MNNAKAAGGFRAKDGDIRAILLHLGYNMWHNPQTELNLNEALWDETINKSIDAETMFTWGEMVSKLKARGLTLPVTGSLPAAQRKQHRLCIITRNVKDFEKTEVS